MKCKHDEYCVEPFLKKLIKVKCVKCNKQAVFVLSKGDKLHYRALEELNKKTISCLPIPFIKECLKKDEHEDLFV